MPDYLLRRLIQRRVIPENFLSRRLNKPQTLAILACEADNRLGDAAKQAAAYLVQAWTEAALGPNAHQRPGSEWKQCQAEKRAILSNLLRDIFGNPFRTISADSRWVEWNDRTVPKLAQAICDEYAFDRLPILADALEESGCTDTDILNHCRQPGEPVRGRPSRRSRRSATSNHCRKPGEHVRGCWVVDLLLNKS